MYNDLIKVKNSLKYSFVLESFATTCHAAYDALQAVY